MSQTDGSDSATTLEIQYFPPIRMTAPGLDARGRIASGKANLLPREFVFPKTNFCLNERPACGPNAQDRTLIRGRALAFVHSVASVDFVSVVARRIGIHPGGWWSEGP